MSNRRPQVTGKPWHNAANYGTTHDVRSTQNQRYGSQPQQCDTAHCVNVVDDVGGFTQMPSKNVPHMDLRVADVAKQTTG